MIVRCCRTTGALQHPSPTERSTNNMQEYMAAYLGLSNAVLVNAIKSKSFVYEKNKKRMA
jgi:hypothetical protein